MARILVVDDEPDIVRFAVAVLEARGHQVAIATDGVGALELARAEAPEAILLDLNLPRMDGREVCRQLKADERTAAIPIVMMTASEIAVADVRSGRDAGADDYLIKPFLRDVLIQRIESLLGE